MLGFSFAGERTRLRVRVNEPSRSRTFPAQHSRRLLHCPRMKLPADAIIAPEKLTRYLLVRQARGDKSAFLARAGYTLENADQLLGDLRRTIAPARCHATSFDQIRAVLRNSRRAHGPKRRHAARSIHLDGRELVWTHEIHYLNPGEMINRALRTLH